jgi:hypothetical protein
VRPRGRRLPVAFAILALSAAPLAAQWQEADTPHFRFIFEPRDRATVDQFLTFCEEVYAQVTGFFGAYPDKVPCIVRGRRDDANGATSSFPSRIDLYVKSPTDFALGTRQSSYLRVLLTHELTHFVHQGMDTGILHRLSALFGPDLSSASVYLLPAWAIEGPAVYDETRFTDGGRGRDPLFEIYLKAAAEENRFFSLAQAGYDSDFPPAGREYVAGDALVTWLQETYGPDALRRILTAYLEFPFLGPWDAISRVTGRSADAVYADLAAALKRRYADAAGIRGGTPMTPGVAGSWTRPQVTARGLYAYRQGPDVYPSIVRLDPKSGRQTVLARASLTDDASFSATRDGSVVWFSSWVVDFRRAAETRTMSDLFVLDTVSGSVKRVSRGGHLWHPGVSADGRRLVAVQGAGPYSRLVTVDPRTGAQRVLFSVSEGNVFNPALSPDGSQVAFILNVRGMQDLYVADMAALRAGSVPLSDPDAPVKDCNPLAARAVLGPDPFGEYFPSFVDQGRILFSSDRSGALALYLADLAEGSVSLVQEDPVAAISGTVDGAVIIYESYRTDGFCLKRAAFPLAPRLLLPDESTAPLPLPPPAELSGASVRARPYRDIPLPYLWLPDVILRQTGPSWSELSLGVGAWAAGGSLLDASRWQVDAEWLPGPAQPSAGFIGSTDIGPLELGVSSRLDYAWSSAWTQTVETSLTADYALFGEFVRDSTSLLSVGLGLRHHAELSSNGGPFTFADSLAAAQWFSWLAVPAIVRVQWSAGGAAADLGPSLAVDAWLQATVFLPVLTLVQTQAEVDLFARLAVPSPLPHHALKLGVKAVQDLGTSSASYPDDFTVPRGFPARTRALPAGILSSVDYVMPVLLDQPLVLGWAVTGLQLGLHAEGVADIDAGAARASVVPAVFAGVEISTRLVYGVFELPVGMGVSARLAVSASASFDPSRDIGLYFFAGFDGFGAGAREPSTAARPSVPR